MGGDYCEVLRTVLKHGTEKSLALRADMVVYEEREAGDCTESGYQRLAHLWEETWHAPRQADRYGPGIGAGIRTVPKRAGCERSNPDQDDRRMVALHARPGEAASGVVSSRTSRRRAPSPMGPVGHIQTAPECDFPRLEAIWNTRWSLPERQAEPPSGVPGDKIGKQKGDMVVGCEDPVEVVQSSGPAKRLGDNSGTRSLPAPGGLAGRRTGRGRPTHRRSRSLTGTEFRRVSKTWDPRWQDEDGPDGDAFIVNELSRMTFGTE